MNIRSLIYWVVTFVIATCAANGISAPAPDVEAAASPELSVISLLAIPEAARSVLLFVGIIAVAFTYHRAWLNFRSGPVAS